MLKIKTEKIGLSCTPSENIENQITTCTELVVSLGCGVNATREIVYGDIVKKTDKTITFKNINGIETIYTRTFIVKQSEVQLVKVVNDVIKHYQYNGNNKNWTSAIEYLYFLFPLNVKVIFDFTKYLNNPKPILKFLDTTKKGY